MSLITLDKWPGVQPIGIGIVLRQKIGRTISESVLDHTRSYYMATNNYLWLKREELILPLILLRASSEAIFLGDPKNNLIVSTETFF